MCNGDAFTGGVCWRICLNVSFALAAVIAAFIAAVDSGTFDRMDLLNKPLDMATTKLNNFNGKSLQRNEQKTFQKYYIFG